MNDSVTAVILTVLTVLELSSASPFGGKLTDTDVVQNRTRPWTDLFLRYPEYPVRRRVCSYKGDEYPDGAMVDTSEPCLKCRCLGGSLVCYLRVCPALPDPPPARCVLLLRRGACCSELICEDGSLTTNHISRAEPIGGDLPLETVSYGDGKGCIDNGTLYGSGSAMATSSLCEYCYCISGEQRCVRPHCLLPLSGCRPRRSPHSCCPVRYDCDYQPTTTTHAPSQIKGCDVDGVIYPEGEKVVGATQSPCDNCFCMRGSVRCVPLSCAPPLLGCTPIVLPGKCCASSYNCSQKLAEVKANNEILQVSETSRENIEREVIINERSFPDDTLLSPSQIATLLLNADGRINRRIGPDKKQNVTIIEDMVKSTENSTSTSTEKPTVLGTDEKNVNRTISMSSTATTSVNITTENAKTSNASSPQKKVSLNESESGEVTTKVKNITETIVLKKNSVNASETLNNTSSLNLESETKVSDKNSTSSVVMTTESNIDISKMIINDTVNCTTELSLIDTGANTTEPQNNADTLVTLSNYNDTEERRPYISGSIDAVGESDDDIIQHSDSDKDTTNKENDISSVGSQFPSTSLIIPKDDDIFMVNVSTFVRTNTSIVTLRPVAAIPPEIEALLNMSINKNNQKDDYFDYDYKSSLPPSLPNLEIIPFLAIDAVDKVKGQSAYGTAYPQVESKNYITSDNFSPTTYAPYTEDKYLSNPTSYAPKRPNNFNRNPVYKQHINDKFQATTYATIVNDNYENHQYAQDKYDATVYPSLTVEDSQTESPSFSFDVNKMNLFSPPSKTEGGFLPRDPPINSYYDLGYPTSDDVSVTDGSLMVTNHAKTSTDDCVSNGRKYKNGELITESRACVVCFCYYGDIHCQDPECPAIKPGCRRKIEKGSHSCCGVEICNDETTTRPQTSPPLVDKIAKTTKSPINSIDRIDTADPFKDVIRTEPAPNLESLIGDMIPHYVRKTTVTTPAPQELTVTKIPTYVIPSKIIKTPSASPTTTTTKSSTFSVTTKKMYSPSQDNYIPDSNSKITQQYSTTEINIYRPPTTTPPPETTYSEVDQFSEDEEEEEFSFGSVLKLLLGDSSDVQTKPTTVRTTRRYTTQTTQASSSWRPSTPLFTRLDTTTPAPTTVRPTTSTVTYPTTTTYRNTYKYSFTKPIRTASPVLLFHKNNTKLGISVTTRAPSVYPTVNRFTKPRHPFNSTPIPSTTQPVKNIAQPLLPPHEQHTSYKRKPILNAPADSSIPFGAGLLKLAGCNIYGRMYRVGKIITELSGPCLECMCTEIGVQCRAISC